MVVPIIIGVGVTIIALTAKSTVAAYRKFIHLTPQMIASLNNIQLNRETSLDKTHPHYQEHLKILKAFPQRVGFQQRMTEQEALQILGINPEDIMHLRKNDLKKRYREMMVANHPDKHGSVYLAQKINQAKDILEKSYMFNDEK
ncbi:uncharacterized protein PRCAT00003872001 [Priceomyces carsonii]|uniref:uncharacterized protein n=1 Tax=Priceomyces carsonii TaxID=28549 RepID=UPI002EDB77FE|nr:unnamed protein product [Priceomyces carsonii]